MTFADAVRSCFNRYVMFSGRARRSEFWWFFLFTLLGNAVAATIDGAVLGHAVDDPGPVAGVFALAVFLPSLAVLVRRLHDTGRSGWWALILLIPLIGVLVLLYWLTKAGDAGDNDHGADPLVPPAAGSRIPSVPRR